MTEEKEHVMLDLETLSTEPDAVIVAIGAVKFTATTIVDSIYIPVSAQSCQDHGLHLNGDTVIWWLKQSDAARAALTDPDALDLGTALDGFQMWFGDNKPLWGNGATFDNVVLDSAYKAAGLERPWSYKMDRCYRTLRNIPGAPDADDRVGEHHNALDDAMFQTLHLQKIIAHFGITL